MVTVSREEYKGRMMRIRYVLRMAWVDSYGLDVIDDVIKKAESNYKIDKHLISMLNHYRKLMQYDLCLSVTRMYEERGHNSLRSIQAIAMAFRTGSWGKFPKISTSVWNKIKAFRNSYLAHLDIKASAEPITNDEMKELLKQATDFYNCVCNNTGEPDLSLSENELSRLHLQRIFDFMSVTQPHMELKEE